MPFRRNHVTRRCLLQQQGHRGRESFATNWPWRWQARSPKPLPEPSTTFPREKSQHVSSQPASRHTHKSWNNVSHPPHDRTKSTLIIIARKKKQRRKEGIVNGHIKRNNIDVSPRELSARASCKYASCWTTPEITPPRDYLLQKQRPVEQQQKRLRFQPRPS